VDGVTEIISRLCLIDENLYGFKPYPHKGGVFLKLKKSNKTLKYRGLSMIR
jgi:hypothetical protein